MVQMQKIQTGKTLKREKAKTIGILKVWCGGHQQTQRGWFVLLVD